MHVHKILIHLGISLFLSNAFAQGPGAVADVSLSPAGSFKAETGDVKGEAFKDGDTVRAENVVVSLKKLKTGIELRDKHAKDKYLEVNKFPEAVLVRAEGKNGKGKGVLKIRGKEKEVQGKYHINGSTLIADFPIKLSDYGISGIKYMGVGVDDEVMLHITLPLKSGRATASKK